MKNSYVISEKLTKFAGQHGMLKPEIFDEFARFVSEIYGEGIQRGMDMKRELESQRKMQKEGKGYGK